MRYCEDKIRRGAGGGGKDKGGWEEAVEEEEVRAQKSGSVCCD